MAHPRTRATHDVTRAIQLQPQLLSSCQLHLRCCVVPHCPIALRVVADHRGFLRAWSSVLHGPAPKSVNALSVARSRPRVRLVLYAVDLPSSLRPIRRLQLHPQAATDSQQQLPVAQQQLGVSGGPKRWWFCPRLARDPTSSIIHSP